MKSITPAEFFKRVSINSGLSDLRVVQDLYYGIVRTITQELKGKHTVKLPALGEFRLMVAKERKHINIMGKLQIVPPRPTVKFKADVGVRKYFHALGQDGTMLQ